MKLGGDAAIFWEILSAKRNVPPNKRACRGVTLIPPSVQSPVRVLTDPFPGSPLIRTD